MKHLLTNYLSFIRILYPTLKGVGPIEAASWLTVVISLSSYPTLKGVGPIEAIFPAPAAQASARRGFLNGVGPIESGGAVLADAPFRVARVVQSRAEFAGASGRI